MRRLLASLTAMAVLVVGHFIPFPGFSWLYFSWVDGWWEGVSVLVGFSVGTLGVRPIASAFLAVELVALLVPPWRRLRRGSVAGRRKLFRAALATSLVFALAQSYLYAKVTTSAYPGFGAWSIVLTQVCWTGLLLFVASWTDRHGIVGGIPALLLADVLLGYLRLRPSAPGWTWVEFLFTVSMMAVAALALISRRWPLLRDPPWGAPSSVLAPPLLAGIVPFNILFAAIAVVNLPSTVESLKGKPMFVWLEAQPAWMLAPVTFAAFLFAHAFYRPGDLRAVRDLLGLDHLAPEAPGRLRNATAWALAFYLVVSGVALVVWTSGSAVDVMGPFTVVAIALDALSVAAFRARNPDAVSIYQCHHVYWAPELMRALRANGIAVHALGLRLRSLGHFFLPQAPIELLVPAASAAAARKLLRPILESGVRPAPNVPPPLGQASPARLASPFSTPGSLACLLLLTLCIVLARHPAPAANWHPVRAGAFSVHVAEPRSDELTSVFLQCPDFKDAASYGLPSPQALAPSLEAFHACAAQHPLAGEHTALPERVHLFMQDPAETQYQELVGFAPTVVDRSELLTTDDVLGYRIEPDGSLTLRFHDEERLAAVTAKFTGQKLGIVLAGEVVSTPVIHTTITGGTMTFPPFPTPEGFGPLLGALSAPP